MLTLPPGDLENADAGRMKFQVSVKSTRGGSWEHVGDAMDLHDAALCASALVSFEVRLSIVIRDEALVLYWKSSDPDIFNSELLTPAS